jgi:hypothetical protein
MNKYEVIITIILLVLIGYLFSTTIKNLEFVDLNHCMFYSAQDIIDCSFKVKI